MSLNVSGTEAPRHRFNLPAGIGFSKRFGAEITEPRRSRSKPYFAGVDFGETANWRRRSKVSKDDYLDLVLEYGSEISFLVGFPVEVHSLNDANLEPKVSYLSPAMRKNGVPF